MRFHITLPNKLVDCQRVKELQMGVSSFTFSRPFHISTSLSTENVREYVCLGFPRSLNVNFIASSLPLCVFLLPQWILAAQQLVRPGEAEAGATSQTAVALFSSVCQLCEEML